MTQEPKKRFRLPLTDDSSNPIAFGMAKYVCREPDKEESKLGPDRQPRSYVLVRRSKVSPESVMMATDAAVLVARVAPLSECNPGRLDRAVPAAAIIAASKTKPKNRRGVDRVPDGWSSGDGEPHKNGTVLAFPYVGYVVPPDLSGHPVRIEINAERLFQLAKAMGCTTVVLCAAESDVRHHPAVVLPGPVQCAPRRDVFGLMSTKMADAHSPSGPDHVYPELAAAVLGVPPEEGVGTWPAGTTRRPACGCSGATRSRTRRWRDLRTLPRPEARQGPQRGARAVRVRQAGRDAHQVPRGRSAARGVAGGDRRA